MVSRTRRVARAPRCPRLAEIDPPTYFRRAQVLPREAWEVGDGTTGSATCDPQRVGDLDELGWSEHPLRRG